jgi:hypothetical protein
MISKNIKEYKKLGFYKPYKIVTTYKFLGIIFYKIIREFD